jgi:L-iduronidase
VAGIKEGIRAAERQYSLENAIKLRGPAGLFKDKQKHKFCWGLLDTCNEDLAKCPIDVITFHRKGDGNNAREILDGSLDLLDEFSRDFPNLKDMKYSNSEADPIKKWLEPRDFQGDTRYAAVLVETVFEHWKAIYNGRMKNLDSISHDNAFLNFHPNFFTQRTLLARFQMNNTTPKHIQFVQKPVFNALGMMGNLGARDFMHAFCCGVT